MKIWREIPKILGVYDKQKNVSKVGKTVKTAAMKDMISISNQAKDFHTAMRTLKEIPDIRQEKVNELLFKYESGKYDVSGREIAGKVVKSIVDKKA